MIQLRKNPSVGAFEVVSMTNEGKTYYMSVIVSCKDNYQPPLALQAMDRIEKKVTNDEGLDAEEKIEIGGMIARYRDLLRKAKGVW